jgi:hypothetical protein
MRQTNATQAPIVTKATLPKVGQAGKASCKDGKGLNRRFRVFTTGRALHAVHIINQRTKRQRKPTSTRRNRRHKVFT